MKPLSNIFLGLGGRFNCQEFLDSSQLFGNSEWFDLNRVVTMYLDYVKDQARRRKPMDRWDWEEKLGGFFVLQRTRYPYPHKSKELYVLRKLT